MNKTVKYKIGIVFLVLAIASPLLVFVVPFLPLTKSYKIALSGVLLAGLPEIFLVLSGIFAGKELVVKVKKKAKAFFKKIINKS